MQGGIVIRGFALDFPNKVQGEALAAWASSTRSVRPALQLYSPLLNYGKGVGGMGLLSLGKGKPFPYFTMLRISSIARMY
jgi:hypothetical protein